MADGAETVIYEDSLGRADQEGSLRPLPYRQFGFSEAVEAFRLMQAAGHIGKIVLVPDRRPAAKEAAAPAAPAVRGDRTYLVTGGLSGFGRY